MKYPYIAIDKENENEKLIVIEELNKTIEDHVAKYDFNKNKITVKDLNPEYDSNQPVVKAVYMDSIEHNWPFNGLDRKQVENSGKVYYFPKSRIETIKTFTLSPFERLRC